MSRFSLDLLPRAPQPGDEMIAHLLNNGIRCLDLGEYGYAQNLFETALKVGTGNRWIYHHLAHFYLAQLKSRDGRPDVGHLEHAISLNPLMPDALAMCHEADPALASRLVSEATGIADIDVPAYIKVMRSGIWLEMAAFRTGDEMFRERAILDFGARTGFMGLVCLAAGARFYAAADIADKAFRQSIIKDYVESDHARSDIGFTMEQFAAAHPDRMKLTRYRRKYKDARQYDFITLFSVTEHLASPDKTFGSLRKMLAADGRVLINHHNFYCWNGHHNRPKSVGQLKRMIEGGEDVSLADWNFFGREIGNTHLNRLTIGQMRAIWEKHFRIERFEATYTKHSKGITRITPEILRRHPDLTTEDLLTQNVRVVLRHRKGWLAKAFGGSDRTKRNTA